MLPVAKKKKKIQTKKKKNAEAIDFRNSFKLDHAYSHPHLKIDTENENPENSVKAHTQIRNEDIPLELSSNTQKRSGSKSSAGV